MVAPKRRTRKTSVPLIIEPHPANYKGYPFITLLQHYDQTVLTIVDNVDSKNINAFVLDLCGPEKVSEEMVITIASDWYENRFTRYPLSFEFSRRGVMPEVSKISRSYNIEFVTRVIGPLPKFEMEKIKSVKRRRKRNVEDT